MKPATYPSPDQSNDDGNKHLATHRERYEREAELIRSEIGNLEEIRVHLGFSRRRLCMLLLVDPSAWTRWVKDGAPPSVYRSLQWLVHLKKLNPDAVHPHDLSSRVDFIHANTKERIKELTQQVEMLERALSYNSVISPTAPIESTSTQPIRDISAELQSRVDDLERQIEKILMLNAAESGKKLIRKIKSTRKVTRKAKAKRNKNKNKNKNVKLKSKVRPIKKRKKAKLGLPKTRKAKANKRRTSKKMKLKRSRKMGL